MRITFAHLCDHAFLARDGKLNAIGIFDQIRATNFPARHPEAFLAFGMVLEEGDSGEEHTWSVSIVDPSGHEVARIDATGTVTGDMGDGSTVVIAFRDLVFDEPGKYKLVFEVDEQEDAVIPLRVVRIEPEVG